MRARVGLGAADGAILRTMADPARRRATYADVIAAPPGKVAEVVGGDLHVNPRPAKPHAAAATALGEDAPFDAIELDLAVLWADVQL